MEARLKSGVWVQATLRQCAMQAMPAVVVRKGDPDSAAILVKLVGPFDAGAAPAAASGFAGTGMGAVVLSQMRTADGALAWLRATGPAPVPEAEADAYVARQLKRDPDLWVIEIETRDFSLPFAAKIVS